MYTYNEAMKASKEYFHGNELPAKIFIDKYSLRDNDNNILEATPDEMHRRLAKEFARIEAKKFKKPLSEQHIFNLLKDFSKIIPQGSPLYGIGNPYQYVSISNCFVLPQPYDSYCGILDVDEKAVNISKRRGGIGISLDTLRPTNAPTKNSSKTSTGILSWMNRYSNSIREVGQNGRRGAMMLTLNVHHPDIEQFITAKNNETQVTGANISVHLTDEFLTAVKNDTVYEQRFPIDSKNPTIKKTVNAKKIWDLIIHNAWAMGEPGIQFIDNVRKVSIPDCYHKFGFRTITSNPCGEIFLSMLDSCRLLAINLLSCIKNAFTNKAYFDFNQFYELAQTAQRLMDDMVDLEIECIDRIIEKIDSDPEPEEIKSRERSLWEQIKATAIKGRRTGLGITGLGDVIAALGMTYGSEECIAFVDRVYRTLKFGAYRASIDMAKELGPFPIWSWELEKDNEFLNRFKGEFIDITVPCDDPEVCNTLKPIYGSDLLQEMQQYGRRNIALLTTAPTGTISIIALLMELAGKKYFNIDSGIEPTLFIDAIRKKKGNPGDKDFRVDFVDKTGDSWMEFKVYHSGVQAWMDINGKTEVDDTCPYLGSCANDINWVDRVKLQATAQQHIDHSISSTINLPNDALEADVAAIYQKAWASNCKGITVYRDGCRSGVITENKKKDTPERPKELPCDVHHTVAKGESYFVLVGKKDDVPYEVFAGRNGFIDKNVKTGKIIRLGKKRYKAIFEDETELAPITATCNEHEETITRLTSALLRVGANMHLVVQQLEKVNGELHGFSKALARTLKKYIPDGTEEKNEECQECHNKTLVRKEGCISCTTCGWSKC